MWRPPSVRRLNLIIIRVRKMDEITDTMGHVQRDGFKKYKRWYNIKVRSTAVSFAIGYCFRRDTF